jgi:hypothetical protein
MVDPRPTATNTHRFALIESDGAGNLHGIWIDRTPSPPDLGFVDQTTFTTAIGMLHDAEEAIELHGRSWLEFLHYLHDRQNLQTVVRVATSTSLDAPDFLGQVRALWPIWRIEALGLQEISRNPARNPPLRPWRT